MIKCIAFDIDDTLYNEIDYVKSGYKEVSKYLEKEHKIKDSYNELVKLFNISKKEVFNRILEQNNIAYTEEEIKKIVNIYKTHMPQICMEKETITTLEQLRKNYKLAIVSDGTYETQKIKSEKLNLKKYFDEIILTDKLGKEYWKPSPKAFEIIAKKFNIKLNEIMYVGDNPKKDFFITKYGIITVRYYNKNGIYYNEEYLENIKEDYKIHQIKQIEEILKK